MNTSLPACLLNRLGICTFAKYTFANPRGVKRIASSNIYGISISPTVYLVAAVGFLKHIVCSFLKMVDASIFYRN